MILDPNRVLPPPTTSRLTVEDHIGRLERDALIRRWPRRRRRRPLSLVLGLLFLALALGLAYALIALDWASSVRH